MSYDYCPANFTGSPQHLCLCDQHRTHTIYGTQHRCVCGHEWKETH